MGVDATATGQGSLAVGSNVTATGQDAAALGVGSTATGADSLAIGFASTADGFSSTAFGVGTTAQGAFATAVGIGSTATGVGSQATANFATAVGAATQAQETGSVAIGTDSTGVGAVAALQDQFVMGTANHTYTAPGITSDLSRARQSGPLEVVTTDADGNLASDQGATFEQIAENQAGIAIAVAMANPDLVGTESFGIAANWGHFDGVNAFAFSAMGVLDRDLFGSGERLAISAGIGFTTDEQALFGQTPGNVVAGRAGLQITW